MWTTHDGVDIAADEGAPVAAALSGTVTGKYSDNTKGNAVEITSGNGKKIVYYGLKDVSVEKDDRVSAGMQIGTLGTPPFEAAGGPHLHFEYYENGKVKKPVFKEN